MYMYASSPSQKGTIGFYWTNGVYTVIVSEVDHECISIAEYNT